MLAVIDYGAGNLRSVVHALNHLGAPELEIVRSPQALRGATRIILPGVGAFGAGMNTLQELNLVSAITSRIKDGIPYLGICLGMQFLFEYSDEMGYHEGFGLLQGDVTRFPQHPDLKVPHMGWNELNVQQNCLLLDGITPESYVYFVHSYYCDAKEPLDVVATVDYGIEFTAMVQRNNIFGVQFHPEKSQQVGLQLLQNFLGYETE